MTNNTEFQAESHALVLVRDAKRIGASRPATIFRLALPLVYAGMGVALGTLTGIGMAFMTVPAGATVAASDTTPSISTPSAPVTSPAPSFASKGKAQRAAVVRVAAQTRKADADQGYTQSIQPGTGTGTSKRGVKEEQVPHNQAAPSKTPDAEKSPELQVEPAATQPRKHRAHPLIPPVRKVLASAPELEPVVLDAEQLSAADDTKFSGFYSEGDLTVADYNAAGGTIESSDGRVFVVGQTVSVSNATSWEDYRSSVHYRCGENGNCTLMRNGAIAPNAKLVQTI